MIVEMLQSRHCCQHCICIHFIFFSFVITEQKPFLDRRLVPTKRDLFVPGSSSFSCDRCRQIFPDPASRDGHVMNCSGHSSVFLSPGLLELSDDNISEDSAIHDINMNDKLGDEAIDVVG